MGKRFEMIEALYTFYSLGTSVRARMDPPKLTVQSLLDFAAACLDCSQSVAGKNAAAWAHNHAQTTDHHVALSLGYVVSTILPDDGDGSLG